MHEKRITRILIADQQKLFQDSVKNYLQVEANLKVVGKASNSEEALIQISETRPDLLLIRCDLPGQPVTELIGAIKSINDHIKIIVVGPGNEQGRIYIEAGADEFVSLSQSPKKLLTAIRIFHMETHSAK
jgi:DNA-binding NarL/FixJ family response regulator